ncbi:MAG: tyrosine-type recombinase/integrase [Candidatus Dadabacteria bacterium]|nr:tyrosine-type recombinase/integrase [Candidatus Dadabacteria bacterium]
MSYRSVIEKLVLNLLVESGIPLHTVAKLLGHSSIRTTERYSHPEDSLKDAVEKLANTNL